MLTLLILIPLVFIFVLNIPRRTLGAKIAPWAVAFTCLVQAFLAATYSFGFWAPVDALFTLPLPIALQIDPISAVMLFLIALVSATAVTVGIKGEARSQVLVSSLLLVCMAGMDGIVMVRDLFSLYIFLEVTAVSIFVLIASKQSLESISASFKYYILSGLASLALMLANALVFMQVGSFGFAEVGAALNAQNMTVQVALILYTVAFCVKAGIVPFHGWLPDAYSSSSSSISVLLAGISTKVTGAYVIVRLMSDLFSGIPGPSEAFMALGALSIVVGAFGAIGQKEMKRMLAFSSISQIGYIILAAGLGTPLALIGAVVHIINHALFKSLLFVNATSVEEQAGTTQFSMLGGLAERLKVTGWTSVVGFLSAAGIPPLSGFWSKLLIIIALAMAGQWVYVVLAILMSLVTLGYFLIMQSKVFFGPLREGFEDIHEGRKPLVGASLVLAALTAGFGILFPFVLLALNGLGMV